MISQQLQVRSDLSYILRFIHDERLPCSGKIFQFRNRLTFQVLSDNDVFTAHKQRILIVLPNVMLYQGVFTDAAGTLNYDDLAWSNNRFKLCKLCLRYVRNVLHNDYFYINSVSMKVSI